MTASGCFLAYAVRELRRSFLIPERAMDNSYFKAFTLQSQNVAGARKRTLARERRSRPDEARRKKVHGVRKNFFSYSSVGSVWLAGLKKSRLKRVPGAEWPA
jgi:hypothetical protein